jgi:hypothetical protein
MNEYLAFVLEFALSGVVYISFRWAKSLREN